MSGQGDPISNKPIRYQPVILEDGSPVAVRVDGNVPQTDGAPMHVTEIQKEIVDD